MFLALAGAMSTAEIGISLAKMIRAGQIHGISCTAANFEEEFFNLLAHREYQITSNYRDLSPRDELKLRENTIVIYFSDNGPNSYRWNGGMKGRKN